LLRPTAKRRCNGRAHRSVTTGAAPWSVAKFARLVTRASRFVGAANRPDGKHPARTKRSPPTVPSAGCGARDRAWFHSIPRPPIGGRGSDAAVRRGRSAGSDVQPALPLPTLVMKPLGFFLRYLQRLAEVGKPVASRRRKILPTVLIGSNAPNAPGGRTQPNSKGEEPALKAKRDYPFDARIRFDTESTVVP
jgi:hypothetical protein